MTQQVASLVTSGCPAPQNGQVVRRWGGARPLPHLATAQNNEQLGPGSGWETKAPRTLPLVQPQAGSALVLGSWLHSVPLWP